MAFSGTLQVSHTLDSSSLTFSSVCAGAGRIKASPSDAIGKKKVLFVVLSALTGALLFSRWKLAYGDRSSFVTHRRSTPSEDISFCQRVYRRVRDPVCFSGDSNDLCGWIFSIELAFRANEIREGINQVDFATSFLQGNALLWFLACFRRGPVFS